MGVLDGYTDSLTGAWSVARRLLVSYSGPLIRVRRDSDNTEQDILPNALGNLDQTALLAFVGAGSAFVTTVYDQQGSNAFGNLTALNQPRIVNAGVVVTLSGKPALLIEDKFLAGSALSGAAGTLYAALKVLADPSAGEDAILNGFGSSGSRDHMPYSDGNIYYGAMATVRQSCGNFVVPLDTPYLMTCVSASNSWNLRLNSTTFYSTTGTTVGFGSTPQVGSLDCNGWVSEWVFYSAAHDASLWDVIEPIFQP